MGIFLGQRAAGVRQQEAEHHAADRRIRRQPFADSLGSRGLPKVPLSCWRGKPRWHGAHKCKHVGGREASSPSAHTSAARLFRPNETSTTSRSRPTSSIDSWISPGTSAAVLVGSGSHPRGPSRAAARSAIRLPVLRASATAAAYAGLRFSAASCTAHRGQLLVLQPRPARRARSRELAGGSSQTSGHWYPTCSSGWYPDTPLEAQK